MIGIGIDGVEVGRFRVVLSRTPSVRDRLFTPRERLYAESVADAVPRLAARFAAKEATMKALGVGLGAFGFHDVEVANAASGAPSLRLDGAARALADRLGVTSFHLSLSHTASYAEAVVAAL